MLYSFEVLNIVFRIYFLVQSEYKIYSYCTLEGEMVSHGIAKFRLKMNEKPQIERALVVKIPSEKYPVTVILYRIRSHYKARIHAI